jgi:hypothetical protein
MKKHNDNSVLTIIFLFFSLVLDFFRSILLLFGVKTKKIENNLFFDFLEFIFKLWPKSFWENPSLYRFFSFFGDLIDYLILKNEYKK